MISLIRTVVLSSALPVIHDSETHIVTNTVMTQSKGRSCHHEIIPILFWSHLTPLLYSKTVVYRGIHYFFYFAKKNIDCGYSLEPTRRGGSNEYLKSMFWEEIWRITDFLSENFTFSFVKFSKYFNRRVFVMDLKPENTHTHARTQLPLKVYLFRLRELGTNKLHNKIIYAPPFLPHISNGGTHRHPSAKLFVYLFIHRFVCFFRVSFWCGTSVLILVWLQSPVTKYHFS